MMRLLFFLFIVFSKNCFSQTLAHTYSLDNSIRFFKNGKQILNPFSGGYQSLYLQTLDLDSNGLIDLIVLNNGFSKPQIFEQSETNSLTFSPKDIELKGIFLDRWFQFVDFDFDGDLDVLTLDDFDVIGVQLNIGINSDYNFSQFVRLKDDADNFISTEFGNFPVVFDYNSDTKFDLFITTQGDGRIRYFKNSGTETSLFHLESNSFGNVSVISAAKQKKHGKSTFSFIEYEQKNRLDIIWGDQFQNFFYYLTNIGDHENPNYIISNDSFDADGSILSTDAYNAPILTDLNSDGFNDLIMLPQFSNANNFHLYISNSSKQLTLNKTELISTIDEGLLSFLDFFDLDSDGKLDLIISTFRNTNNYYHLSFYKNTGISSPEFSEFDFSKTLTFPWQNALLNAYDFQIIDLNNDLKWDIVFTDDNGNLLVSYNDGSNEAPLFQFYNTIRNGLGNFASFRIIDINNDNKLELISANQSGRVQLRTTTSALFDQNISTNLLNMQFDGWINIDGLVGNSFIIYHQKEKKFYRFSVNSSLNAESLTEVDLNLPDIGQSATLSIINLNKDSIFELAFGNQNGGLLILKPEQTEEKKTITPVYPIFPNPAKYGQSMYLEKAPIDIQLFNLNGQKVRIKSTFSNGVLTWIFPKQITSGVYFLRVDSRVYKIIKIN